MSFSAEFRSDFGPRLGNNGNNVALPAQGSFSSYQLRRWLWSNSSLAELRRCGRVRRSEYVQVAVQPGAVRLRGFCQCHSIWACPVCAPLIRQARGRELSGGLRGWVADGHSVVFVTLTLPHDVGDRLAPLFDGVAQSWRAALADKSVRNFRKRVPFGFVRSVEVTDAEHGWHPHLHSIVLVNDRLSREQLLELRDVVFRAWCSSVERRGWRPPSPKYGIEVRQVSALEDAGRLGEYVTKQVEGLGQELTRLDSKRSRKGNSPFQLLCLAAGGDLAARARWWEYESGTFGRRAMSWSQNARDVLRLGADVTDEQALETSWRENAVEVGSMSGVDADLLVLHPNGYELLCEVLVDDPSIEGLRFAIDSIYRSLPLELLPPWHPYREVVNYRRLELAGDEASARSAEFAGRQELLFDLEPF